MDLFAVLLIIIILLPILLISLFIRLIKIYALKIVLAVISIALYLTSGALLFKFLNAVNEELDNGWFLISFISIMLFWLLGPIYIIELLYNLDKSALFLEIFKDNISIKIVISIFVPFIISLIVLLIPYNCEDEPLQTITCLLPVVVLFVFLTYSTKVCTKSYSNYMVTEITNETNLRSYTVKTDTKIYCGITKEPSVHLLDSNGNRKKSAEPKFSSFPTFLPLKYSFDSFKKGDVIYVLWEKPYKKSHIFSDADYYIKASNGKKAGFIEKNALEK